MRLQQWSVSLKLIWLLLQTKAFRNEGCCIVLVLLNGADEISLLVSLGSEFCESWGISTSERLPEISEKEF